MMSIRTGDPGARRFTQRGPLRVWSIFWSTLAWAAPCVDAAAQAPAAGGAPERSEARPIDEPLEHVAARTADEAAAQAEANAIDTAGQAATDLDDASRADGTRATPDGEPAEQTIGGSEDGIQQTAQRPTTRLETLLDFSRLAEEERYDEALPLAEQLLELTEAEFGPRSLEAAEAYETVARVQTEADEHVLSEQNFLHAIELIRSGDGTFSALAIAPLVGLGDNYHDSGEYLSAVTAYNEARTINRRVYGLLNEAQIPILDRITESMQELDQYQEADEQQLTILHLAERNYPEGSPEYLEAIYRYARWLRESGRYHEEREQYSRAERIIRDQHGKESVLLVRPLRETGNSFRDQRIPEGQGISALRSALEILEMPGNGDPLATAAVLRDLGDWEVAFSRMEPDLALYRRAWQLLDEVDDGERLREEWFGQLENVLGEPISQRGLSTDPDALRGHVVVQFDLDRNGRTQNVAVTSSDPPGLKDEAVARAVRRWRFRPFMSDGEVVPKEQLALQFNYRYSPDEEAE